MDVVKIREICLLFHGAKEDVKWGNDLCFTIGGKMFCVTGLDQPEFGVSIKVSDEEYGELIEKTGIISAPYAGRYKWIHISDPDVFTEDQWKFYIRRSYEMILAKLPRSIRTSFND